MSRLIVRSITPLRFKIAWVLRIVLGALFMLAGGLKILDPAAFALEIEHYQLLPWWGCALVALFLPWLEVCVGIGLLVQPIWRGALVWAIGLLLIFSAALLSAMLRGLSIDCGCLGRVWQSTGTFWPFIRNLVLLGITFLLWRQPRHT